MKTILLSLCLLICSACGKQSFEHPTANVTMAKTLLAFNESLLKGYHQGIEKLKVKGRDIPDEIQEKIYYTELIIEDYTDIINGFVPDGRGLDFQIKESEKLLGNDPHYTDHIRMLKDLRAGIDLKPK